MALRDAAGLLSGLRKVAAALYVEGASELQHMFSNTPLQPLTSALSKAREEVASGERGLSWAGGGWYAYKTNGLGESLAEWNSFEEGFPSSEGFPGTFKHSRGVNFPSQTDHSTIALSEADKYIPQTQEDRITQPSSSPHPPPPPPSPPLKNGPQWTDKRYHTLARQPCSVACHRGNGRWLHSGPWLWGDAVLSSRASDHVETAKNKRPKPKQKVKLYFGSVYTLNRTSSTLYVHVHVPQLHR